MINDWYFVGFMGTKGTGLYTHFEKEGFNHCFIFYAITEYEYMVIEHAKTYVQFVMASAEEIEKHLQGGFIIQVKSKRKPRAKWWWWIPTPDTCVTITKQILGIQKPFIWTPYQLYKHILKEHKWVEVRKER